LTIEYYPSLRSFSSPIEASDEFLYLKKPHYKHDRRHKEKNIHERNTIHSGGKIY
jgi:hypothetical protein